MKYSLTALCFVFILTGCNKTIDKIQEDLVIKAMTDGQWKVTSFIHNGNDITTSFSTYKFQYYSNKTVDAFNNGVLEKTGTWDGNATTMTTSANFLNVNEPLSLINGNWHIDDNGWTFVEARQTVGADTKTMRLDKL